MKVFVLKKGQIVNKETGEAVNSLSGKFNNIEFYETQNTRALRMRVVLKTVDAEGDDDALVALSLERYGIAAVKVMRLLAGCAHLLNSNELVLKVTKDEDEEVGSISLTANGTEVSPAFDVPYSYAIAGGVARRLYVDQVAAVLNAAKDHAITAAFVTPLEGDDVSASDAVSAIESNPNVRADKVTFANEASFLAWKNTVSKVKNIKVFTDADDIQAVLAARYSDEA